MRYRCSPFSVVPGSMRQGCPDVYSMSSLCCHAWPEEAKLAIPKPSPVCLLTITLALGCLSCGVRRPSISGISPRSATAGGNSFLLSVDGSDFRLDSAVSWNGSFRVTSFVSSDRLVAAITPADIAQPCGASVCLQSAGEAPSASIPSQFAVAKTRMRFPSRSTRKAHTA